MEGLLLPTERHKTLTGLAHTEPYVGAKPPRAQGLHWFVWESSWQARQVQECRLRLRLSEPSTAPHEQGVLVIDEHGDRKRGHKTAHIGKQYLANLGKLETGVVWVTSLWADEQVYYPLDFEPSTPATYAGKRQTGSAVPHQTQDWGGTAETCSTRAHPLIWWWWLIPVMARIAARV